jgi:Ser/Thr protein kinase RdoA (MazF antagonist)
MPLLPNDPQLRESPDMANTIGTGIGRLDRVLAQCPRRVSSFTDDPAHQILGERYIRLPPDLRALTSPLRGRLHSAVVDLPMQRTHGDCNVGNLLVHNGIVTGYIDLDHLPTGPRIYDLSNYLVTRLNSHVDHGTPDAMMAVLRHYVAGYHANYPLSERELVAVVPLMLAIAIAIADWHLYGPVPNLGAYERDQRLIEWLAPRYDALVKAITAR